MELRPEKNKRVLRSDRGRMLGQKKQHVKDSKGLFVF